MNRITKYVFFKLSLLLFLSSYFSQKSWSQDYTFSQFYSAPLHVNPAMIGFSEAPRITFNMRDQLSSFDHAFVTVGASYDQYFYKYRSAVGFSMVGAREGDLLNTYHLNGHYAYQLPFSGRFKSHFGVQGSFVQQSIDFSKIIYPDMISANGGLENLLGSSELPLDQTNISYFDLGAGFLFYSPTFYFGATVKHLTNPNLNYTQSTDPANELEFKYGAQLGGVFYMGPDYSRKNRFYISPNLLFETQGPFSQINGGIYAGKNKIFGGLWMRHTFRNVDALIALLGVKSGIFKIGYSYDFTISGLNTVAGAHEISVSLDFGESPHLQKKIRQRGATDCPVIFHP